MSNLNFVYKCAVLFVFGSMSLVMGSKNVLSQTELEEVVVTGIRKSVQEALVIKEDATNFVDALSAEDIGKLPDSNIAEALQRVTGVAIQRDRGEGDFVSIRGLGPDFVRGTTNGRSIISATEAFDSTLSGGSASRTGRATNFDILPSEIINTLEVIKSPSAEHVEGGIGGIVNVKTARPLDYGQVISGSVQGTYRDFNEELDPSVSGLYSWTNEQETFGFIGSIAYSERNIREDFDRSFGWLSFGTYDTDADGLEDLTDIFIPLANNVDSYEEQRERLTLNGTFQWQFNEDTEVVVDVLYTERDLKHSQTSAILVSLPFGFSQNPDGSRQVPAASFDGNTLPIISSNLPPELVSDEQNNSDELLTLGINVDKQIGVWNINFDGSYAKAEGSLAFDRAVIVGNGAGDGGTYLFDFNVNNNGFSVADNGTASLSDPANYFVRNGRVTRTQNDDEEYALQLDLTREVDSNFLSAVKTGMRYRNREKKLARSDFDGPLGSFRFTDVGGNAFRNGAGDFLDGGWGSINYNDFIFADTAATLAEAAAQGTDITPRFDPLGTFDITEETVAAYVQLDLSGEIGDIDYVGNIGFRVVHTDQSIGGFSRPFTIDGTTVPGSLIFTSPNNIGIGFDDNYVNVLPSFNLRLGLMDDLYLRMAASESLTRPTFNNLAPSATINPSATIDLNNDGVAATAVLGNPFLQPYESTNFDIGLEWYFDDASAVYAGIFYKEIDEFIAGVTNLDVLFQGVTFDSVTQPDNQGQAEIIGVELGYQHAFDNGLGYIINGTFTDNSAEFTSTNADLAFEGVSDISYNLIGYYDMGSWQARIAYSYRSDFLDISSDVFTNTVDVESYGQLDASLSYEITENLTAFVSGVNLTSSTPERTTGIATVNGSRFLSRSELGTRISFGIRGSY